MSTIEKRNSSQAKEAIVQDYNMMSKSSATAKNYPLQGCARWKLFKCKECNVWTHAINEIENKYALLLNNRVKDNINNIGLLNAS